MVIAGQIFIMILVDEDNNEQKGESVVDGREERVHHVPVQA